MSPHQDQPPNYPAFWDAISAFGGQNNLPGQGLDHNPSSPTPFSGAFPFSGGMHYGTYRPPHPPHHGRAGGPNPPPPPPAGPGVGHDLWDQDWEGSGWYRHGHEHDENSREARRENRRERRGCRRRDRHHRYCDDGTDEEGNRTGADKDQEKKKDKAAEKEKEKEKETRASPNTMNADVPDPIEVAPEETEYTPPPFGRGFGSHRGSGRGGFGRGGWHRGRGMNHGGRHCPRGNSHTQTFDFPAMMRGFINHPFLHNLREQAGRYRSGTNQADATDSFAPPVDMFNTDEAFVAHVALPGAKKEDVGVDWNPDTNTLRIAGVIHRPGDEDFIQGLVSGERRVGLFERDIPLPPPGLASEKEDIDGFSITAKMEDGVLIVTVPKTEKEWTEIRKVDVQ